jgi:hypothetical protein
MPVGGPSGYDILDALNKIYGQAGVKFHLVNPQSGNEVRRVPFDVYENPPLASFHDGAVQHDEFQAIENAINPLGPELKVVLARKSADSRYDDDKPPFLRGEGMDARLSIVFTSNSASFTDRVVAHEIGHLLDLASVPNVVPGKHDPGPFPPEAVESGGGLMQPGDGVNHPGLWLAHEDWKTANDVAKILP